MSNSKKTDFGSSLQKLEEIVSAMEEESLPLEDLIKYYEKGSGMVKQCEDALQAAHKQLEVIRKKSEQPKAKPSAKQDNPDDEIRLF